MADYKKVVEMFGDNFASCIALLNKWVKWDIDFKQLVQTLHQIKKVDLLGLIAGTHEIVVRKAKKSEKVVKKVTKFIMSATMKLSEADLKKKFITGKKLWVNDEYFQGFLSEAFSGGSIAPEEDVSFDWYSTVRTVHDDDIYPEIGENIIDLSNAEGCREACKRLSYMRTEMENKLAGKSCNLRTDRSNFIGRFRLKSGRVCFVRCFWFVGRGGVWICDSRLHPSSWESGTRFLST